MYSNTWHPFKLVVYTSNLMMNVIHDFGYGITINE